MRPSYQLDISTAGGAMLPLRMTADVDAGDARKIADWLIAHSTNIHDIRIAVSFDDWQSRQTTAIRVAADALPAAPVRPRVMCRCGTPIAAGDTLTAHRARMASFGPDAVAKCGRT